MAPGAKKGRFQRGRMSRAKQEEEEIKVIDEAISAGAPMPGSNPLASDSKAAGGFAGVRKFSDMPLSNCTKKSLKEAKFVEMTAIQRATLPHALCGRDVLGAAKTGSGKTLSFVIPLLECLFRHRWASADGLGALVISPTRELAVQIFEEMKKAGKHHSFSAGLLIGGKNVAEERSRIYSMNILICTPGRLLQHMDETPNFDCSQIQMLVLDEADRCLDLGFSESMNAILDNLPRERQTLLFSATQTRHVRDLARLSLVDPEYISVHAEAAQSTPQRLQQAYTVCELHEKTDVIWSFIKSHLKCKTLVFLSTCKQVQYVHEAFRKLRPGVPIRLLHGKMKQQKRMTVFYEFCEADAMVLFATDVAARGLDFPAVDWVLQGDCPEDSAAYIHRVGRTARYTAAGRALMVLTPSELAMLGHLEAAKIPIKAIKVDPKKRQPVQGSLQALLSKETELKHAAQKALVAYLRSVFLQPDKKVFDVHKLPAEDYAHSLGLPNPPKLRFLSRAQAQKELKLKDKGGVGARGGATFVEGGKRGAAGSDDDDDEGGEEEEEEEGGEEKGGGEEGSQGSESEGISDGEGEGEGEGAVGAKRKLVERKVPRLERLFAKKNAGVLSKDYARLRDTGADDDDDDDLLVVKRVDHQLGGGGDGGGGEVLDSALALPMPRKKKLKIRGQEAGAGSRKVFDEEGNALDPLAALAKNGFGGEGGEADTDVGPEAIRRRLAAAKEALRAADKEDKAAQKRRLKELKREKRRKRREEEEGDEGGYSDDEGGPVIGGGSGSEGRGYGSGSDSDGGGDGSDSGGEERREEVAHAGMLRKKPKVSVSKMSLSEQESLALRMLSGGGGS